MTRRSFDAVGALEFLYLRTADDEDLYVQWHDGRVALAGMEPLLGFRAGGPGAGELDGLRFETTVHTPAPGVFRWPAAWVVGWDEPGGPARLELRTRARRRVFTWGLAGLAMSVVGGELRVGDGPPQAVHGLGELLAVAPRPLLDAVRRLARLRRP